jgi:hypothetical protein
VQRSLLAICLSALLAAALPALSAGATREPLSLFRAELRDPSGTEANGRLDRRALAAAQSQANPAATVTAAAESPQISSTYYGPEEIGSVLVTLESLPHGPEMAGLSVYVATPEEIAAICGETVLACYFPDRKEMVVSGENHGVAGVPRAFAIAHEYGHHIANSQPAAEPIAPIDTGTIRWATYERVCQFARARRLFPGNQGAHYWQDPEEAFAETYAHLADPADRVSWQYTPLLAPSAASLAKVRADVARPWSGPVSRTISGTLAEPPPATRQRGAGGGREAIAGAAALGTPAWVAVRRLEPRSTATSPSP